MSCFELITIVVSVLALIISLFSVWYTRQQYRSGIKPDLFVNIFKPDKYLKRVAFGLNTREHIARILKITPKTKNIRVNSNPCPYDLEPEAMMYIYFDYVGNGDIQRDNYKIRIDYTDKDNNSYHGYIKQKPGLLRFFSK